MYIYLYIWVTVCYSILQSKGISIHNFSPDPLVLSSGARRESQGWNCFPQNSRSSFQHKVYSAVSLQSMWPTRIGIFTWNVGLSLSDNFEENDKFDGVFHLIFPFNRWPCAAWFFLFPDQSQSGEIPELNGKFFSKACFMKQAIVG
jgi:hypothetical protein